MLLSTNTCEYPSVLGVAALPTNVFCAHCWLHVNCFYIIGSYRSTMNIIISSIWIPQLFLTHNPMYFFYCVLCTKSLKSLCKVEELVVSRYGRYVKNVTRRLHQIWHFSIGDVKNVIVTVIRPKIWIGWRSQIG